MAANKDFYQVLGVVKSATAEEIKKAYRKLALEWHPDRHREDKDKKTAEERFKEINEAYQVLSDPKKKQTYDQFGAQAFAPGGGASGFSGFGGQGGQWGPFTYSYSNSGGNQGFENFGDPFEIFEQFFGGNSPFAGGRGTRVPRYSMTIDFMDALKGVEKIVTIEGKKRKIKIPPGVDTGSRIKFPDFVLTLEVLPSKIYERDGADLYLKVAISFSTATLGGEIPVPTPWGEVKVKIRAGTQPGTMLRLKNQGVPKLNSSTKGDEYISLTVKIPEKLTHEQQRLLKDLKENDL